MASALYPLTTNKIMQAQLDLVTIDMRVILIDVADYTYSDAHDFLDDVPGAARVAVSSALTGKAATNAVFDAGDVTLTAVAGDPAEALILYRHTGVDATSELIAYIDGFSVTPDGGNIIVTWDSGASKIFEIG